MDYKNMIGGVAMLTQAFFPSAYAKEQIAYHFPLATFCEDKIDDRLERAHRIKLGELLPQYNGHEKLVAKYKQGDIFLFPYVRVLAIDGVISRKDALDAYISNLEINMEMVRNDPNYDQEFKDGFVSDWEKLIAKANDPTVQFITEPLHNWPLAKSCTLS